MIENTLLKNFKGYIFFPSNSNKSYNFFTQIEWIEHKDIIERITDEETFWHGNLALQNICGVSIIPKLKYQDLLMECFMHKNQLNCILWRNELDTYKWLKETYKRFF